MWEAIDNLRGQQISERLVSINSEMIIWAVNWLSGNPVVFCEEIDSEIDEAKISRQFPTDSRQLE